MKRGLVFLLSFLYILQVVSAAEDLGGGVFKESGSSGVANFYKMIDGKRKDFKTVNGIEPKSITLNGIMDTDTTLYFPTLIRDIAPKDIVLVEDYDRGRVIVYKTLNGKQIPEPVAYLNGQVSIDAARKEIYAERYDAISKKKVMVAIQFLQGGEIRVFEDKKLYKQVLADGKVTLYRDNKPSASYDPSNMATIFPVAKTAGFEQKSSLGLGDPFSDKIWAKENISSFEGKSNGNVYVLYPYKYDDRLKAELYRHFWIGGEIKAQAGKILMKKLPGSQALFEAEAHYPFEPSLSAERISVEFSKRRDVYVSSEESKLTNLSFNEYRQDNMGRWAYIKDHLIRCIGECRFDYVMRSDENSKEYMLNITGPATMVAPDKERLPEWKADWKKLLDMSEAMGHKNIDEKAFSALKMFDVNVSDLSVSKINSSGIFLNFVAMPLSDDSMFSSVRIASKGKSVQTYMGINVRWSYTAQSQYAWQVPVFMSNDLIIRENNLPVIGLFIYSDKASNNYMDYYEDGQKYMTIRNGPFYIMKLDTTSFEILGGRYPAINFRDGIVEVNFAIEYNSEKDVAEHKNDEPLYIKLYPDTLRSKYKRVEILKMPLEKGVLNSIAIFEKSDDPSKKMSIKYDGVISDSNTKWTDYGVSFGTYIYDQGAKTSVYYECKIEEQKCYLNGKQVNFFVDAKLKRCMEDSKDNACPDGETCVFGVCTIKPSCKKFNNPSMNGPISLLFINDGAFPKEQFKQALEEILGYTESGKPATSSILKVPRADSMIFNKRPFKTKMGQYSIYYIDDASLHMKDANEQNYLGAGISLATKYKSECPNIHYPIVISRGYFGSAGSLFGKYKITSDISAASHNGAIIISKANLLASINVISHEMGHTLFGLADEYYSEVGIPVDRPKNAEWNCVENKAEAKRKYWSDALYDMAVKNGWRGCGMRCEKGCSQWLKTSDESIMSRGLVYDKFNTFSADMMITITDWLSESARSG